MGGGGGGGEGVFIIGYINTTETEDWSQSTHNISLTNLPESNELHPS